MKHLRRIFPSSCRRECAVAWNATLTWLERISLSKNGISTGSVLYGCFLVKLENRYKCQRIAPVWNNCQRVRPGMGSGILHMRPSRQVRVSSERLKLSFFTKIKVADRVTRRPMSARRKIPLNGTECRFTREKLQAKSLAINLLDYHLLVLLRKNKWHYYSNSIIFFANFLVIF